MVQRHGLAVVTALTMVAALLGVTHVLLTEPLTADGERYQDMAVSLLETGEFRASHMTMRSPQAGEVENGFTHYFSPLWPAVLVPFYVAAGEVGFSVAVLVACSLALAAACLTTRQLYGDASALVVVAGVGAFLQRVVSQRGSEPLALVFFVLMLFGILRSIEPGQGAWILLAGAAAGAAYLTRSSVGWLFVLGGAAGFLWRIRFHRRDALNRHYLGAIAIFGACWTLWALRNLSHFWDGSLADLPTAIAADAVFQLKFQTALGQPLRLSYLFVAKIGFGLVLVSPLLFLRRRELAWQLRNLADERASGLFLAWSVPLVMAAAVAAVFLIADVNPPSELWSMDNLRYFVFTVPGLVWGPWRGRILATKRAQGSGSFFPPSAVPTPATTVGAVPEETQ